MYHHKVRVYSPTLGRFLQTDPVDGRITTVIDGNGNRAELGYDGHGRQDRWAFPSESVNDALDHPPLSLRSGLKIPPPAP